MTITNKALRYYIKSHPDVVKRYLQDLQDSEQEWVDITEKNCPTLKKYGCTPFRIMKRKMRKDGKVWNTINFFDAKKEAETLGYRLPDIREILALLEHYKNTTNTISCYDKEFLGIEELSYSEDVNYEWIEGAGCAALRGGFWGSTTSAGPFPLYLYYAPSFVSSGIGFRLVGEIK